MVMDIKREKRIVGEPGGPSGPFFSVVCSTGRVVAMQIIEREDADLIANIPEILSDLENARDEIARVRAIMDQSNQGFLMQNKALREATKREKHWQKVAGRMAAIANSIDCIAVDDRDLSENELEEIRDYRNEIMKYMEFDEGKCHEELCQNK